MDESQQKEQFSNAYVRAIAATAGYTVYKPEVDLDSIDWGIAARGGAGTIRSPKVELQLKCTAQDILRDDHLAYPLKIKNYDELRHEDYQVPRVLVVVLVPDRTEYWLRQSEESLALYRCGYWLSLRGHVEVSNSTTVTVKLPRSRLFSVEGLTDMMERIAEGGLP